MRTYWFILRINIDLEKQVKTHTSEVQVRIEPIVCPIDSSFAWTVEGGMWHPKKMLQAGDEEDEQHVMSWNKTARACFDT
ncbi:hypothetical protein CesoFtcFv8_027452 [Champsocephalus esox]|uniref:Uncharacterized protein n=1 Tax=Champsocephalus esox TaxID=159716 RepID=A0AAN7YEQ2_9TELE|nr:hypothetical protein CesoFtcFv8_027452 [Champsocephalus esox]